MRRENSGLIDLDALLKEASQPELPESAEDSLEVTAPPPEQPTPPKAAPPPSTPRPPSPPPSPPPSSTADSLPAVTPTTRATRERAAPIPWIVALAAGITVIAIVVTVGRSRETQAPTSVGASIATPVVATTATPSAATTAVPGTWLSELPPAAASSAPVPVPTPPNGARPSAAPPATASAQLVAIADAPPTDPGDLGGAMREAVGPRSSADVAVADPTPGEGARQLRPSPGAVVGAINSVMPAARICLGDSEVVRNATIVFRSDGTVARVDIAGSPNVADECIRGALSKARTMPFVADTFAARATVRP